MKRLLVPLVVLLVCVFVITGCGTASPTPTTPAATTPAATTPAATTPAVTTPAATKPGATTPAATTPAASSPAATKPAGVKTGGILKFITPSSPGTPIGWMQETAGGSTVTMQLVLDFLLYEQLDGTLVPNIAESYELDASVPSIVFKLKRGVRNGDGSEVTAQTVKWNLETTGKGPPNAGQAAFWKSFDVIDDYTLKVTFTSWQNRLLRGFADASTYLYSKEAFDKNGLDWMRWNMVGPGPFKQVAFQRDVVTKVTKNEYYFNKGLPYLDGVELLYVLDELTRVALFKSGGGDVMDVSGNGRIAGELKDAGYTILSKRGSPSILVPDSMNADSPWSNPKVRQAAEYAIDREAMARTFGFGYSSAAYQLPSPSTTAYDPNFAGRKYDIARAKALLTEAGFPTGFKTKLYVQTGGNQDIPVAIQAFLRQVGIQVELEYQDAAKYTTTIQGTWNNGLILNTLLEWPNYNNGFNFYFGTTSPFFKSLKKPDGWSEAFQASMTSPLPDVQLMRKAINLLFDDATIIPLTHGSTIYATHPYVRDTGLDTRSSIYWNKQLAWLDK